MANASAICTSFKTEILNGHHAFGTSVIRAGTTKDSFKAALYYASASPAIGAATTAYSATGEVSDVSYAAGGVAVTNAVVPSATGTTSFWTPSAAFAWVALTAVAFDAVLLYNTTQSNKAVAAFAFGSQTVTAGNFSLNMPTNDSSTAAIRLA